MKYAITDRVEVLGKVIIKGEKRFSFLSYLLHDKANVLIDTVPVRSGEELVEDIRTVLGEKRLDAIIMNHSEEDHSGALPAVLAAYPDTPVYCTAACRNRLLKVLPQAEFHIVRTGEILQIDDFKFVFQETPGLHWDDNMVTFLSKEKILFSNDLFGQMAAAEPILDREYTKEDLLAAADKYYTNVFEKAAPEEKQAIRSVAALPIRMIAPGHGVILQQYYIDILNLYLKKIENVVAG